MVRLFCRLALRACGASGCTHRRLLTFLVMLVAITLGSGAAAQIGEAVAPTGAILSVTTAPVVIDGRALFHVRGVTAYPASRRAADIAGRIAAFAADRSQGIGTLHTEEVEHGTQIAGGTAPLMLVLNEDARIEGVDRRILAHSYMTAIARAVTTYRQDRTQPRIIRDGALTLGATLLAAMAAFLAPKLLRSAAALVERRLHNRLEQIEAGSFQLIQARTIWDAAHAVMVALGLLLALSSLYLYLHFVLNLYPWTRGSADRLLGAMLAPLALTATGILRAIPGLIVVAIIVIVARYVLVLARRFFAAITTGRIKLRDFDAEWADPTLKIARLLIVVFAAVIAYPYVPGSQSAAFKGMSIFVGVLLSLGSSSLIANLIAGYTMTYRRAFRVGDRIAIGRAIGEVTDVRLMVTHLRSVKNEELIIPNSSILAGEVTNFSSLARDRGLILHTTVGIGYETSWRQVEAMLLMAAERTAGLLRQPPPFVLQKALGDFCVSYELNVYSDQPLRMDQLYTELHRQILDVFNEYRVQIMTPAYRADPATPKITPKDQWYAAPALREDATQQKQSADESAVSAGRPM